LIGGLLRLLKRASVRLTGGRAGPGTIRYEERIDMYGSAAFTPTSESMGIYVNDENMKRGLDRTSLLLYLGSLEHGGRKVFERIMHKSDIFEGAHRDEAPDYLFRSDGFMFSASILSDSDFGGPEPYHDMNAVFMLRGEGIKKGMLPKKPDLADVAPTVLHLFGLPVPTDMDGAPVLDCFENGSRTIRSSEMDRVRKAALKLKGRI